MRTTDLVRIFGVSALLLPPSAPAADFDGDGRADIAVYRPASGFWAVRDVTRAYLGSAGDLPAAADYDGDGTSEIAVFRPASGRWAARGVTRFYLGRAGDRPIPGDYGGDGTDEGAVFRESAGLWAVRGVGQVYFGSPFDLPVPGDYDGDGRTEKAAYRIETGLWAVAGFTRFYFGSSGDYLVLDDFNCDGAEEAGVYRPASGLWAIRDLTRAYLGGSSDLPQPGDFAGGGSALPGIFRPSAGLWAVKDLTRAYQGALGDIPVAADLFRPEPYELGVGIEVGRSLSDTYYLQKLIETGAVGTRKNYLSWARLEPSDTSPENFLWDIYDQELAAAGEGGMKTIVVVSDVPSWAAPTSCGPIDAESLPEFAEFLSALVSRYSVAPYSVKHWELFNEPDGTVPYYGALINCWGYHGDQYAGMLKTAYPAIKSADPDSRVVLGGLAYDWFTDEGGIFNREFIVDVLDHGGGDYFDVLNFHYYYFHVDEWSPYGRDISGKANYLNGVLASHGVSKPAICTETGIWGNDTPYYLDLQASYVPQVNVRGMAAGLQTVLWFPLVDGFTSYHGGLIEEDGRLKPAFSAYTTLAAELDGYVYGWTLSTGDTGSDRIEGYAFRSRAAGKTKEVLWATQSVGMRFYVPQIRVVSRDGAVQIIADNGPGDWDRHIGRIGIPITPRPIYVEDWE